MDDYGIGNTGVKGSIGCEGTLSITKPELAVLLDELKQEVSRMVGASAALSAKIGLLKPSPQINEKDPPSVKRIEGFIGGIESEIHIMQTVNESLNKSITVLGTIVG